LGRGLEALLGRPLDSLAADGTSPPRDSSLTDGTSAPHDRLAADGTSAPHDRLTADGTSAQINVFSIDPNRYQPRQDFDDAELESLAESIRQHGVIQPMVVRRVGERFELISGERRLRAAIKAGWTTVPCQIRDADDRQVAELAIVENVQRKDLNPLEKAASFQRYLEQYACTQEELAQRIQIDRSTIANLIRLLELPAEVQQQIRTGAIGQGHARALLPLGDEREQVEFCRRIVTEQLSVRAVEELVSESIREADDASGGVNPRRPDTLSAKRRRPRSQHIAALEQELRHALGTKVEIRQGARGRGKLVVHFSSGEEFERIRQILTSPPAFRVHHEAG
jgi:ParB family chromosome partitioning protein